jgi:hypothetical protein
MSEEALRPATRKPRRPRDGGRLAAVSLALGSLATVLGNMAEIKKALFELLGPDRLQSLHIGMSVLVAGLFVVGYSALGWWLWRRYVSTCPERWRQLGAAGLVLGGLLTTGCSVYVALPPQPDVRALLTDELDTWSRELIGLRKGDGTLRSDRRDPSAPDQVWNTAQALNALLLPPATPAGHPGELRDLLDAIEAARLPEAEGWGYYNDFSWGVTEVAGWVLLAEARSLRPDWSALLWTKDRATGLQRLHRDLELVLMRQLPSGAFAPVSQPHEIHARTYSSVVAVWALVELRRGELCAERCAEVDGAIRAGVNWLLKTYEDGVNSWVPRPGRGGNLEGFPGLSGQAIYVLERARPIVGDLLSAEYQDYRRQYFKSFDTPPDPTHPALRNRNAGDNDRTPDGDLALPGKGVLLEGSTFLWFPWALAACSIQADMKASADDAALIARSCSHLGGRLNDLVHFAKSEVFVYIMAESLLTLRLQMGSAPAARPA